MKIWRKIHFLKKDKKLERIIHSYVNYVLEGSNFNDLIVKYKISAADIIHLRQQLANRMAGIYLLTIAKDEKRLHDIILKYQQDHLLLEKIIPEIEGYIEK